MIAIENVSVSVTTGQIGDILVMFDTGFCLSMQAVSRQLAAMPAPTYFIRLIHFKTRRPFPGERLWTVSQIVDESTMRFLRARNREGFDIYFRPYAEKQNAGYILVDLDKSPPVVNTMRLNGHDPCVVVQTSPGHFQAWIRVCDRPLAPTMATQIARHLAQLYHGDRSSADWRHIGRLAGFTNQKPQRRLPNGWPPWVKLRTAQLCQASKGDTLVAAACHPAPRVVSTTHKPASIPCRDPAEPILDTAVAVATYQTALTDLHIPQRFSCPDWSIVDLWIARMLLMRGRTNAQVKSVLRLASPGFPRSHANPEDYLRRTLERAVRDISNAAPFPARQAMPCIW